MTALLVLGVVNNDKRDTLSFKLQVGLPALAECIKEEIQLELKCSWSSCLCSFLPVLQQFPRRKQSIIFGSVWIHHCSHLTGASSRQWQVETSWQGRKHSLLFRTTGRILAFSRAKLLLDVIFHVAWEPHINKQQVHNLALHWARPSDRTAIHTTPSPPEPGFAFCPFSPVHCRVENKQN